MVKWMDTLISAFNKRCFDSSFLKVQSLIWMVATGVIIGFHDASPKFNDDDYTASLSGLGIMTAGLLLSGVGNGCRFAILLSVKLLFLTIGTYYFQASDTIIEEFKHSSGSKLFMKIAWRGALLFNFIYLLTLMVRYVVKYLRFDHCHCCHVVQKSHVEDRDHVTEDHMGGDDVSNTHSHDD